MIQPTYLIQHVYHVGDQKELYLLKIKKSLSDHPHDKHIPCYSLFTTQTKNSCYNPSAKKRGLDNIVLSNFRPISKLSFLSKMLENVVTVQLQSHLDKHNMHEPFQSDFHPLHSTETALLRVVNDLLLASDSGALSLLVDLRAAFDTVCHSVLLSRLCAIGITSTAFQCLTSYLSDRQQFIKTNKHKSCSVTISCGVPQGSVLGPLLFLIYILPNSVFPLPSIKALNLLQLVQNAAARIAFSSKYLSQFLR